MHRVGPYNENLKRLEDYEWFIRFGHLGGKIMSVNKHLMIIQRSDTGSNKSVQSSADMIIQQSSNYCGILDKRLMYSYLYMELAVEALKRREYLSFLPSILLSVFLKPRFRLHLANWWLDERA